MAIDPTHRLWKGARSKESQRGFFSYLTEGLGNLLGFYEAYPNSDPSLYFHLYDIPGYGKGNAFEAGFVQDSRSKEEPFINIEKYPNLLPAYELPPDQTRFLAGELIKKHFTPRTEVVLLLEERLSGISLESTIGVHRRSTDIGEHHPIVPIQKVFKEIDLEDPLNIILATDSVSEAVKFRERYGDRVLFWDNTASPDNRPFFKRSEDPLRIDEHIKEIVFSVYALAQTRKIICSKSNLSMFSLCIGWDKPYTILE